MNSKLRQQIEFQGMNPAQVEKELIHFQQGFPFLELEKQATIGDGIISIDNELKERYISQYNEKAKDLEIVKFVPASGAATRMFKDLFDFLNEEEKNKSLSPSILSFVHEIRNFAFADVLDLELKNQGSSLNETIDKKNYKKLINALLSHEGLNYSLLPKGLLLFHKYDNQIRTPIEEHFSEGIAYAKGKNDKVRLHFTISPEHLNIFKSHVEKIEMKFPDNIIDTTFSQQKLKTNTVAVDLYNQPFRDEDGDLLFRPAGHGALLENLNEIDADIIYIKNIDNVVPDRLKEETISYKKAIAGLLLEIQHQCFIYLHQLENNVTQKILEEIEKFAQSKMFIHFSDEYKAWNINRQVEYISEKLNRPIRVCGMVRNTGEPGGGPFWVINNNGEVSLQIVETSQLDLNDPQTSDCISNATHFNPVDLVCGVRNYKGDKFDLLKYRDSETGFITQKSKNGRELKALELSGLWNGAMADWNTLFVEVPLITFNPVKTINDLLRPEHQ